MTSEEFKEVLDILVNYAKTGVMCLDRRQENLIKKYAEIMSNENS